MRGVRSKFAELLHGSVLRSGLRERRVSRVVGQVRPTVGGIGVGGSRVLESEAETPPLAGAVCVLGKPVFVLDVQGRRLQRDVRTLGTQERRAFERHCHFQGLALVSSAHKVVFHFF